jgi:hypothetical protein
MWLSNSEHISRMVRIVLVICFAATVAAAQDSRSVLLAIERGSQTKLPNWSVDLTDVQSPRAGVMRWLPRTRPHSSGEHVSLGLLILDNAQQAHHHFDESVAEDTRLFKGDKSIFSKTKLVGVADETYLFTFRRGNPSVTLRKGKYFVTVDGTSLRAVKTLARVVANQLPAT